MYTYKKTATTGKKKLFLVIAFKVNYFVKHGRINQYMYMFISSVYLVNHYGNKNS